MAYNRKSICVHRGGAHLPIAHAVRLMSTQELRFWVDEIELEKKEKKKKFARGFFGGGEGQLFFEIFKSLFFVLNKIEFEKN